MNKQIKNQTRQEKIGMERKNAVYTQPNIISIVNCLSFFKPMRPKLLQTGQTRYQSSPLYLYIHNWFVALVHVYLCWIATGKSSLHTVSSQTSVATVTMVPIIMTTLVGGWKHGNIHYICQCVANQPCMFKHNSYCLLYTSPSPRD